jgi:hypothetical protein
MALKVIGAGFGRTGTLSLKTALEKLGFGKCYHMVEILRKFRHMEHWATILCGGKAAWETLFNGYQSAVDWPVAAYYRDLMHVYPDAKVILTVRDPHSWHRSIMTTLYQAQRKSVVRLTRVFPPLYRFLNAMEHAIWQDLFQGRLEDKEHAIRVFQKHIDEVRLVVPPERLLIFEARQGWQPLCSFLNVPVPVDEPYPHRHKGNTMRQFLRYTNLTNYR